MHKKIAVYDSSISARVYLSYIAEQAGGFACIGRDGKLYIRTIGEDTAELPLKYFQNFSWGEKFKISRVKYEDGIQLFEKGDESGNTIYINQDNMYIVDQEQIDNIYDLYKDLEVYSFEGDSIIDPALDIGDILIIDGKKVIYQGSSQYSGKFKASISSKIQSKAKEETTTRTPSQKTINRRVQSQIDQENAKITQLTQETTENSEKIVEHEQTIDGFKQTVENIETTVETVKTTANEAKDIADDANKTANDTQIYAENINNELNSKVENVNDEIESVKTTVNTINTNFEQTSNSFEASINTIKEEIVKTNEQITENETKQSQYLRYYQDANNDNKGTLELGESTSPFKTKITNEELAFTQDGNKVSYINGNKMYITIAEILNALVIGNFGFTPMSNGSLTFGKVK
jgi:predicted  nucleic acid-binding Zn-ribbon protein